MRKPDGIFVHSQFDVFLDNIGNLFNKPRRKELWLGRMIAADDVTTIAQHITNKTAANQMIHFNKCPLIYWACCCNSYRVLLHLLAKSADCNQPGNKLGWRSLDHCIQNRDWSLTCLLLLSGNADARLILPSSKVLTSFDMADKDTQAFIEKIEMQKQVLLQLKAQYEEQKHLADKAYKQADITTAQQYYGKAADTCKAIANWWHEFVSVEEIPVLKEHYQKQVEHHIKMSQKLANAAGEYQQTDYKSPSLS